MPSISKHITVGLNSTVRHLETLSSPVVPNVFRRNVPDDDRQVSRPPELCSTRKLQHLAIIFILQSNSDIARAHLPVLARTASLAHSALSPTILVPLSARAQTELVETLQQPRAGMIGIMEGAPGAQTLICSVRERVAPVDVPWLEEAITGQYLTLKWHDEAEPLRDST